MFKRSIKDDFQTNKKPKHDYNIIEKLDIILDKLKTIELKIIELESTKYNDKFKGICPYIG